MLRTPAGMPRRTDTLSVVLAMREAIDVKGHYSTVQKCQKATVPLSKNRSLPATRCSMHMDMCGKDFGGQRHWCIAWDPGMHSGTDMWVGAAYAVDCDRAAYAPPVLLRRPPLYMLDQEVVMKHLERGKKIERLSSYVEMVAVDHAMHRGFGTSLHSAAPWEGCVVRPLHSGEFRVPLPGNAGYAVATAQAVDAQGRLDPSALVPELPDDLHKQPTFVHFIDQGSVGASSMNFLINSLGYFMLLLPDPNHRVWNDIKNAMQRSSRFWWETVVFFTLVFNVNYGPFGKGHHFDEKKQFFENWKCTATVDSEEFLRHKAGIAKDNGLPDPESVEDMENLLKLVREMRSFVTKGPLVKLMRSAAIGRHRI